MELHVGCGVITCSGKVCTAAPTQTHVSVALHRRQVLCCAVITQVHLAAPLPSHAQYICGLSQT
jgi:hypothetical protein